MIPRNYNIPGVAVTRPEGFHDDERRTIIVIANSNPGDISAGQIKALVPKKDAWLGGELGHFHGYPETYSVLRGKVTFYLQEVMHPERRQAITLEVGERLMIPTSVAHKVFAPNGSIFVGVTEQPYRGPNQDVAFEVTTTDDDFVPPAEEQA